MSQLFQSFMVRDLIIGLNLVNLIEISRFLLKRCTRDDIFISAQRNLLLG